MKLKKTKEEFLQNKKSGSFLNNAKGGKLGTSKSNSKGFSNTSKLMRNKRGS